MTHPPLELLIEPVGRDGQRPTAARVDRVVRAVERGDPKTALRLARTVAEQKAMSPMDGARLWNVFNALDAPDHADAMRERVLDALDRIDPTSSDDFDMVYDSGFTLAEFQRTPQAIATLKRALELDPSNPRAPLLLLTLLLQEERPEEAVSSWKPMLAAHAAEGEDTVPLWSILVRALSYFGFKAEALAALKEAEENWQGTPEEYAALSKLADGSDQERSDLSAYIANFDVFATRYDENLAALGNRGPLLIGKMMETLEWEADAGRHILDAGCGTGLCAPYLRPYAKLLHGCDLSIQMLERSKERRIFDLLTRTDLAQMATYPEGMFDVAIVADVLVYFGELESVFTNLSKKLHPGGWLLFTIEDATRFAPSRGWEKHSSGRFRHMPDYVTGALTATGFTRPKQVISGVLRHEFGVPVDGLCMASQKLSLTFGTA